MLLIMKVLLQPSVLVNSGQVNEFPKCQSEHIRFCHPESTRVKVQIIKYKSRLKINRSCLVNREIWINFPVSSRVHQHKQSLSCHSEMRERKHTKSASRPRTTQRTCPEKGISLQQSDAARETSTWTRLIVLSATESVRAATKNNQTRLARECRMSTTANWKPIHGSFAALLCFYTGTMARTAFRQQKGESPRVKNLKLNLYNHLWKKFCPPVY